MSLFFIIMIFFIESCLHGMEKGGNKYIIVCDNDEEITLDGNQLSLFPVLMKQKRDCENEDNKLYCPTVKTSMIKQIVELAILDENSCVSSKLNNCSLQEQIDIFKAINFLDNSRIKKVEKEKYVVVGKDAEEQFLTLEQLLYLNEQEQQACDRFYNQRTGKFYYPNINSFELEGILKAYTMKKAPLQAIKGFLLDLFAQRVQMGDVEGAIKLEQLLAYKTVECEEWCKKITEIAAENLIKKMKASCFNNNRYLVRDLDWKQLTFLQAKQRLVSHNPLFNAWPYRIRDAVYPLNQTYASLPSRFGKLYDKEYGTPSSQAKIREDHRRAAFRTIADMAIGCYAKSPMIVKTKDEEV